MKDVLIASRRRHISSPPVRIGFFAAFARSVTPLVVFFGILAIDGVTSGQEARHDNRSLSLLFGDAAAPDALEVYRRSRQMPAEQRYEYLMNCVLPDHSDRIRLAVDYLPTNPAPPVLEKYGASESPPASIDADTRVPTGGILISPAIELVKAARKAGKLKELKQAISQRTAPEIEQVKSRLAIEILIAWADEDLDNAADALTRFVSLVRESPTSDPVRQPEMAVLWSSLSDPETIDQVYDLLQLAFGYGIVDLTHAQFSIRYFLFQRHLMGIKFQVDDRSNQAALEKTERVPDSHLEHWVPVSRRTATTEGIGYPNPAWVKRGASVQKIVPHSQDFLYYSLPLRGEFEIEADLSTFSYRDVRLGLGNHWIGPVYSLKECEQGTFHRKGENLILDPPLPGIDDFMRVRIESRAGRQTFFINGRVISSRPHGAANDPWLAIVAPWYGGGIVKDLRITGSPEIPAEINLLGDPGLPGWIDYFDDSNSGWRIVAGDAQSTNILVGRFDRGLRGSHQESLLRYCRPMLEDGVIEYEFFYGEGTSAVYPALGRCCFLFDRERAGIHWLTDGKFDRTGADPANFSPSQNIPTVPLMENEWNQLRLTLKGDTVEVALNGTSILTRKLEPENLRTFGLFHYSDRTLARVRNLRWRGEWPKTLPAPPEQELADYSLEEELAAGPELPIVFEHDFSEGLPSNKVWGGGREGWHFHKKELPQGVRISKRGGWYSHHTLSFPIRVEGDFDIRLEYEDLQTMVAPGGEADVQLGLIFEDELESDFRLCRKHQHHKNGDHKQLVSVSVFQQLPKHTQNKWPRQYVEESNAGTMRCVRRGDQLFLLHAAKGSPHFRLVHRHEVTTAAIRFGGIKAIAESHLDSEVRVIWKHIAVRAEHPTNFAERDAVTVEMLGKQRAELPESERFLFNAETPESRFRFWGNSEPLQKQDDGWQVKQLGTENWLWWGFSCMWGVKGDYDVTLELDVVKLEEPIGEHETYFLLKNLRSASVTQDVEFKVSNTRLGKRELVLQFNTYRQSGSWRYEKIKIQSVESVNRLRFARREDVLYILYRAEGDTKDTILAHMPVRTDDVPPGYFLTMCRTGGEGKETIIKVKSMDVRATELIKRETGP